MSGLADLDVLGERVAAAIEERTAASRELFDGDAARLARLCHQMAERFARDGRLVALGRSPAARSDARHVAVEFVHPVIVGKRALPAIALCSEGGDLAEQVRLLAEPEDILLAFEAEEEQTATALAIAEGRGCLTVAFPSAGSRGDREEERHWEFAVPSEDPYVRQELTETLYHVLWELVHVFFEHRGLLRGRSAREVHDAGASSFLYPFLDEREQDLDAVMGDVRGSVLMKAREVEALRAQTLGEGASTLSAAGRELSSRLRGGGRLLAAGNGGSATDAMDVVADFRAAGHSGWRPRPALDLTEDAAILTAIANDIGVDAIFARQVIAHGRSADALLMLSTSGSSANVLAALAEARRRELLTIALVGYDGGQIAADGLAEHVIVTRSSHIPRIQEAQASAYHVLRELVELADDHARGPEGEPR